MEELVTSRTKIQMTYICGDERHILSFKILRFWSFIKKKSEIFGPPKISQYAK